MHVQQMMELQGDNLSRIRFLKLLSIPLILIFPLPSFCFLVFPFSNWERQEYKLELSNCHSQKGPVGSDVSLKKKAKLRVKRR